MTTNNYPGIGYKTQGYDENYYQKFAVSATTFGGGSVSGAQPDAIITFSTQSVIFTNLTASGTTNSVVEFSFNGQTVHGELDPTNSTISLTFDNRVISMIWFRVKGGSSGTINISVNAWEIR